MSHTAAYNLYQLLTDKTDPHIDTVKQLISENYRDEVLPLLNIIKSLRIGELSFQLNMDHNVIKVIDNDIQGELKIISDKDNKIERVIFQPHLPEKVNFDELTKLLNKCEGNFSVNLIEGNSVKNYRTKEFFDIASLSKLVVAAIVYSEIENQNLTLNQEYTILPKDISFLSTGIHSADVGSTVTIKKLLSLMLIASDNTAMDILLKLLGKETIRFYIESWSTKLDYNIENVKLISTKDFFGQSWCQEELSEAEWRKKALTEVKWTEGLGYFMPVNLIVEAIKILQKQPWLPWRDYKQGALLFKGGSAPGVLCYSWASLNNEFGDFIFILTFNSNHILSYLKEVYIFSCCRLYFESELSIDFKEINDE
ncbi:serine hydrolase [Streptococcus dentapri]|uniref:Serine hydrolase n=1 Tax=Streptococcus dentapri TaxID=573564 RepID=A0ABV8CYX5_9STRE